MKFNLIKFGNNFSRILILLVIIYILFNLGRSIFNNYSVNEKIAKINNDIADLEKQNQYFINQNLYYQTDTFKELEARRKLGLKKEGETVIIAPDNKNEPLIVNSTEASNQKSESSLQVIIPNYIKWWNYVLGK